MDTQLTTIDFQKLKEKVLRMLASQIDASLSYHNVNHTIDVLHNCERIAMAECITDEEQLLRLKIAALYHDTGFLFVYKNHEEKSCEIFRNDVAGLGLQNSFVEAVCSLIMATKTPQAPKSQLEEIICDADLDYLGRDDFESISNCLRTELFHFGLVEGEEEWHQLQIRFLETHRYFTKTAKQTRAEKKAGNLWKLKLNKTPIESNKTT